MKILNIIKFVFIAISVVTISTLLFMREGDAVDIMLKWSYVLMGIAIAILIVMPAINLAKNPKGAVRSLAGLLALVVLAAIFYAMSSATPVIGSDGTVFDKPAELKWTDTGLYLTYFALAGAIVVALFGEIRNSFK